MKEINWIIIIVIIHVQRVERIYSNNLNFQAVFEYIDVDELDNILIATKPVELEGNDIRLKKFTHCELHPTMILGHLGFYTPFANNSQSVRNIFGAGQGKQAVGIYTSNFRYRMDNGVHTLNYPQKTPS